MQLQILLQKNVLMFVAKNNIYELITNFTETRVNLKILRRISTIKYDHSILSKFSTHYKILNKLNYNNFHPPRLQSLKRSYIYSVYF